jgi:hypothetical protein
MHGGYVMPQLGEIKTAKEFMIDDALIQGVLKIANYRLKKSYPLLSENHYSESDVRWILESLAMILEEYDIQQSTQGNNRKSKSRRSKSVCEVPKE